MAQAEGCFEDLPDIEDREGESVPGNDYREAKWLDVDTKKKNLRRGRSSTRIENRE